MIVSNDRPTVFFDVDSTLVFSWDECPLELRNEDTAIDITATGDPEDAVTFYRHDKHENAIMDFHARGHNVIVWSAGGANWAAAVVKALCLEGCVYACLEKPRWYFDDKTVDQWMPELNRTYLRGY